MANGVNHKRAATNDDQWAVRGITNDGGLQPFVVKHPVPHTAATHFVRQYPGSGCAGYGFFLENPKATSTNPRNLLDYTEL